MSRYAAKTGVAVDRSRTEIERTLQRYGATTFAYGWESGRAMVGFQAHGRRIRFLLPLPDPDDPEFTQTPTGLIRSASAAQDAYDQSVRQRWRALALAIKAKLEAVESGIASFEDEFLAYTLLPDGSTVGEWAAPQLDQAFHSGLMPSLLPALPPGVVE